ncbi:MULTISPECIES: DUF6778 family protein [unclassified Bradyrhizobium]|uniref:DUF6778 family protein n=1 Tax=unclassified Bradyrhizobium TaxID=2631580 RepID=UPI002916C623|nr:MULTISPECIES: DUF6778 family protein [unclassified Bradyrhizobium]
MARTWPYGRSAFGVLMLPSWLGFIVAGVVLLTLAGCVTAENALSQSDIAGMKLTAVNVGFTPNAIVMWDEGERAYASAKALPDEQLASARRTQEFKDYVHGLLGARIKAGVEGALAGQLNGPRPVRLEIVVRRFQVPSVASRVLIGWNPSMFASATLVDARTGAVIVAHPDLEAFVPGGRGIIGTAVMAAMDSSMNQTPDGRLIARYGQVYREWLTHGA